MSTEVTINDIWPKLKELGLIELRINNRMVWSDDALNPLYNHPNYVELIAAYNQAAEKEIFENYKNFRVTNIAIEIVEFHHCIADVKGYYDIDFYECEEEI